MKKLIKNNKAFTIIELIVIMAILAIFVTIGIPKMAGFTKEANITKLLNDAKILEDASHRYYLNSNKWPKADMEPMTDEDVKGLGTIIDFTKKEANLDKDGDFYYIDFNKLGKYAKIKTDPSHFVLQNPVGRVYIVLDFSSREVEEENPALEKPTAVITMTLDGDEDIVTTDSIIAWSHSLSTVSEGCEIVDYEWENKQDKYIAEGEYTVKLRVKSSNGLWSEWVEKSFCVTSLSEGNVKEIVGGFGYTLALLKDGTVMSFGKNNSGQLGLGDNENRNVPTLIPGLFNVKQVSSGGGHSLVLFKDGTVMGFGKNDNGQLGLGDNEDRNVPTLIPGLFNVKQVACGNNHSLVLFEDGTVMSFGRNFNGQLGLGNYINKDTPTTITELSNIKQIACGYDHSLALLKDGTIMSFGVNQYNQLGLNTSASNVLSPALITRLTNVKQITSGAYHSLALIEDGTIAGFGKYDDKQLFKISDLSNVKQVVGGVSYSLILFEDGRVKKIYDFYDSISSLTNVKQVSAGYYHYLILFDDGSVMSYGGNESGELGLGHNNSVGSPTLIANHYFAK